MPNSVASGLPNAASYDTSQPGVMGDKVTGLFWERQVAGHAASVGCTIDGSGILFCPWRYAAMYCAANRLGGFDDWRLPTILELASIVDYAAQFPSIDGGTFPSTPYEPAWTATRGGGGALDLAWAISFSDAYARTIFIDQSLRVRCVRGGGATPAQERCYRASQRFQLDATTATDAATGLIWQKGKALSAKGAMDAAAQCAAMGGGARVPSINELLTLVDFARSVTNGPLIDTTIFPQPGTFTWSSTVDLAEFRSMWSFSFSDGWMAIADFSNAIGEVRCVR